MNSALTDTLDQISPDIRHIMSTADAQVVIDKCRHLWLSASTRHHLSTDDARAVIAECRRLRDQADQ